MKSEFSAENPAVLALADGTTFSGVAFGAERTIDNPITGEVVFNTSMFGYQEILTDPSYAGQILCFTYPHIGNVGCNLEDVESHRIFAEGLIVRDLSRTVSNFRATKTLAEFLGSANVMGLARIDTRALVSHLRDKGAQSGALACGPKINSSDLVDIARKHGSMDGKDYVKAVACTKPYTWAELPWQLGSGYRRIKAESLLSRPHVVAVDCGIKYNILRLLTEVGFRVTVVPAGFNENEILALRPDALFLSNGPGDPATLDYVVKPVAQLLGKLPIFGICLGHQILAQSIGAKTYKLKFGHRGGNHPVIDNLTKRVEITVQNHGFAVSPKTVPDRAFISQTNLNDQTVEGLVLEAERAFSIQYHPESSPGPHDALHHFRRFFNLVVSPNA